jgi:hypothetical protein
MTHPNGTPPSTKIWSPMYGTDRRQEREAVPGQPRDRIVWWQYAGDLFTYLIHITGNKAMPGVWMSAAALIGLVAALMADGGLYRARSRSRDRHRCVAISKHKGYLTKTSKANHSRKSGWPSLRW